MVFFVFFVIYDFLTLVGEETKLLLDGNVALPEVVTTGVDDLLAGNLGNFRPEPVLTKLPSLSKTTWAGEALLACCKGDRASV
jgi:hypothetical protein